MRSSFLCRSLIGLALACVSVFASAYEYVAPMVHIVARDVSEWSGVEAKFKAELAAHYGGRTIEAARANGLMKESNGFRVAAMFKADGLPSEVGWQSVKI